MSRAFACCIALIGLAVPLSAQNAAPQPNTPISTLRTNSRAVLVDVIATDSSGKPVTGLPKELREEITISHTVAATLPWMRTFPAARWVSGVRRYRSWLRRTRERSISREDHVAGLNIKPDAYAAFQQAGVPLHAEIRVPKGNYRLRTGVYDQQSHKVGTMEVALSSVVSLPVSTK